jgi:hypothetical protein
MIADKSAKLFFGWRCSAAPVLDVGAGEPLWSLGGRFFFQVRNCRRRRVLETVVGAGRQVVGFHSFNCESGCLLSGGTPWLFCLCFSAGVSVNE